MRSLWGPTQGSGFAALTGIHARIFALRTSRPYVATIGALKRHVFPLLFALALVWLGLGWGSHLLFNVFDSMGFFCTERQGPLHTLNYDNAVSKTIRFSTNDPCARTGVALEANQSYSISFKVVQPWKDWWIPVVPLGRESGEAPSVVDELVWRAG